MHLNISIISINLFAKIFKTALQRKGRKEWKDSKESKETTQREEIENRIKLLRETIEGDNLLGKEQEQSNPNVSK